MKKLFALVLALCLLCGCTALAEETPEMNWSNIPEDIQANGQLQQIAIPDMPTIIYWIPSNMAALDVSSMADTGIVAAYSVDAEDITYTTSVFALNITSLEEYLTGLQASGADTFNNVKVNGIDCVSVQSTEQNSESLIVPMTDTMILYFVLTPMDGDDEWDQVKGVIVSSIQIAQ